MKSLLRHSRKIFPIRLAVFLTVFIAVGMPLNLMAQSPIGPTYIERQTFGRRAFDKDNNVWVYTTAFANTFGMPAEHVQELRGFEAAAFRVQPMGFDTCGYGGNAENCAPEVRCLTDVYFDESKTPLPWANDQQSDWLGIYNSSVWIRVPGDTPITPKVPAGVIPNKVTLSQATLHPFADPKTKREVTVFASYTTPQNDDSSFGNLSVYGFKRAAVAGLTMVTLSYRCESRNSTKRDTVFRLEAREAIASPTLARLHEFVLPESFEKRIDAHQKAMQDKRREFYKAITNLK
jgi:hypothetical protein